MRWRRGRAGRARPRDRAHATGETRPFAAVATTSAMFAADRSLKGAASGSAPGSIDSRARWSSSMSASNGSTPRRQRGIGAGIQNHRHEVEEHALEQPVQVDRRDPSGAPTAAPARSPLGQGDKDSAIAVVTAFWPGAGKASATFRPDLTSRSASPPRTKGQSPGNGGSGNASRLVYNARIGKPHRSAIQQAFGSGGRSAGSRRSIWPTARYGRAPALFRFLQPDSCTSSG